MNRKKKLIGCLAAGILLAALMIPEVRYYKDGGTKEYHAVLYQIIHWHSMRGTEGAHVEIYYEGMEIRILGKTVYNSAEEYKARYCE